MKSFEELLGKFIERVTGGMDDDFNTALAIGNIFELIRALNKYLDGKPLGAKAVTLVQKAEELLKDAGSILNIFTRTPEDWNRALMRFKCPDVTEEFIISKYRNGRRPGVEGLDCG